jgi:hypothetical protein
MKVRAEILRRPNSWVALQQVFARACYAEDEGRRECPVPARLAAREQQNGRL